MNNNDDDIDASLSSDESLSIEFPPPPTAFSSSPPVINGTYQFKPVKTPFVQTTIVRSDSGEYKRKEKFNFYFLTNLFSSNFVLLVSIVIIDPVGFYFAFIFCMCLFFVVTVFDYAHCLYYFFSLPLSRFLLPQLKKLTI